MTALDEVTDFANELLTRHPPADVSAALYFAWLDIMEALQMEAAMKREEERKHGTKSG